MKKKNVLFIFSLILFVCVSGCDVLNPVIDPWWEGTDAPRDINGGYMYTQESFVVSFDSGGGNYVDEINGNSPSASPQRVWAHAHASVPGLVAKGANNYFTGWYDARTGGAKWDFAAYTVDKDMTLFAQWEGSGWTVDFIINFPGSGFDAEANLTYTPLTEYIADGALAAEPLQFGLKSSSSYVNTYVFIGWYKTEAAADDPTNHQADKWDFAADTVTQDEILYAGWAQIMNPTEVYTVRFVSDADKNPPPNQYVLEDTPVIAPYVTYRDGSSFGGWYKDAACTVPWVFATNKADQANDALDGTTDNIITLYAKWAPVAAVDVLKDVDIVDFRYILFSGGQWVFNDLHGPGSSTDLTDNEKSVNNDEIDAIINCLNANPHYRVMVVGHANPATEADKANPLNAELLQLSGDRADAVKTEILETGQPRQPGDPPKPPFTSRNNYLDTGATPIVTRAEGGRRALENPMLSRRVEIIVFDIITKIETVTP